MKQKLLLCLFLLFPALASADNSGTCGENLTYTYQEATGTLSISGTGAMTDFTSYNARPWHSYCSSIQAIVIGAGVTGIDDKAFYQCTNLTSIIVEEGNTKYDSRGNCNALIETAPNTLIQGCVNTVIPSNITTIGEWAFAYNSALTNVSIPEGVTTIGAHAFMSVRWLNSVTIPSTVTSVGEQAFFGCSRLASVTSFIENPFEIDKSVFQYSDGANYFGSTLVVPEGTKAKYEATPAWNMFQSIWELVDGSGTCGENLTYTFEAATGTLTISGTGAMKDGGTERDRPWFYYHQSIKVVNIEPGVTSIGNFAFTGCTSLPSINIPNSVTRIGVAAFEYCTSLTSISIPEGVTTLDSYAFRGCTGLTSISLPETITTIKNNAFDNCIGLTSVHISDLAAWCKISFASNPLYYAQHLFLGGEEIKELVIPNSVTSIRGNTFRNCIGFTSVTIPNSVTSIEGGAFANCTSLTSFNIPESVTNIGSSAFNNTGWYNNHEDGLLYLDNWLLGYKGNIPTSDVIIEKGTKGMADGAFSGCNSLTSVAIPTSITSISDYSFQKCTSLTSINIPESVTTIGGYAFSGCTGLTSITLPENVITICACAFSGCTSLTSITIPESVTTIGSSAFNGCISLISIILPEGVTTIDDSAFKGCSSLASISIPENVSTIGGSAFQDCTSLTSISIPESVANIGRYAFYGCTSLTSITSYRRNPIEIDSRVFSNATYSTATLTIPYGATARYQSTLWNNFQNIVEMPLTDESGPCGDNLTYHFNLSSQTITITGTGAMWDTAPWYDYKEYVAVVNIESGVSHIGQNAFYGCSSLTSISIPESITTIGGSAFSGCTGLTNINIPENVTTIGSFAFSGCTSLTSIIIPDGVTTIDGGTFSGCTSLTSIIIPEGVTTIGNSAFNGCTSLTSINIPENVTIIGISAFSGCTGLTSINIPENVTTIGNSAFNGCIGLNSFNIPESVTNIGSSAFNNTGWYNNLEDGLIYLDNWLIGYKGDIASGNVEIQEGTKGMAGGAFSRCTSLTSIIIPNSITAISESAFTRCTNLTSINIPESVTTIDITAFYNCTSLTSITIPSKVDSIGHHAFYGCTGLTSITSLIEDPYEIDAFVFSTATYSTAILYVPKDTKARYEATPAWSQFQTIEEMALAPIKETTTVELPKDSSTENVVVDNVYYNLSGDDGYDPTDDCLIINNATDTENANGDPGSDEVKENFNGIIIEVYGKGSIEIDCQTLGAMMLSVKVGDADPQNEVMSERGTVTDDYDVTAPTYVYIYSTANAALARRVVASDNCVKLWGITVKPNIATSITDSVQMASDNKLYYSLDGRRQQNMPTKKGLYIVNGKKMIVK